MDSVVTFIGPFPRDLDITEPSFWKLKWNISTLDFAVIVRDENKLNGGKTQEYKIEMPSMVRDLIYWGI